MKALIKVQFKKPKGTVIIPLLKNESTTETLDKVAAVFGVSPERLKNDCKGDMKETMHFYDKDTKVYILGLGEKPTVTDVVSAFRNLSFQQKSKLSHSIAINFIHSNAKNSQTLQAAVSGMLLGIYRIGLYKSEPNGNHPLAESNAILTIFVEEGISDAQKIADKAIAVAETQIRIMDLVNASPNNKPPQYLANWALMSGNQFGFTVTTLDKKACEKQGLHALLSVNKGSSHEPRFIIMEYKPQNATQKVGLVGKGITFDTGGISIKPSANMHLMKSDMGGAAAVLGTMELTAKLQLPIHLIGIVPSTENMVDGDGTKPGDVIQSYSGKTIEVIDTDAEGRLILADGLSYMKRNFDPDIMIDLATLTGSVVATLGYNAAGLFSNDDTLADALSAAGDTSGERVWRLPLWDIYMDDMKSDVADISNLTSKPMAGAITAAKFLELFTDSHSRWAHLDIAGVTMANNELGNSRVATAYGIRLLNTFLENLL